jgi:hypothetical protein
VLTPGVHALNTNAHEVPAGGHIAHIGSDIHVVAANGTVVHVVSNVKPSPTQTAAKREQTGWITFAYWLTFIEPPISSFTSSWTVPAVPTAQHGQTLFLFNSIENVNAILQPVLQVCCQFSRIS